MQLHPLEQLLSSIRFFEDLAFSFLLVSHGQQREGKEVRVLISIPDNGFMGELVLLVVMSLFKTCTLVKADCNVFKNIPFQFLSS